MNPDWQCRRSAFNHDWLKNRFLTALASFSNILDNLVDDPETEERFVQTTLPQWPARAAEAWTLVDDFQYEMSPKILFLRPPLSRCRVTTMAWLPDMVHGWWYRRLNVEQLCADAHEALMDADSAYQQVTRAVTDHADPCALRGSCLVRDRLEAFHAACERVAMVISNFPSRIEVV